MRILHLAVLTSLLCGASGVLAGEAEVTRVRGSKLTIDVGSKSGLLAGLEVQVVRTPTESIVHPKTGENMGRPEIRVGIGTVREVYEDVALVELGGDYLFAPRVGDVVRYHTPEELMLEGAQQTVEAEERNRKEHAEFSSRLASLAQSINRIDATIRELRSWRRDVELLEENFKTQLSSINGDLITMKEDIASLKEQVALYGPVPVGSRGESPSMLGEPGLTEEDVERIAREVYDRSEPAAVPVAMAGDTLPQVGDLGLGEDELAELEGEEAKPFYLNPLFILGLVLALGIIAVTAFLYLRMTSGSDEDEEDEEDEELEEDEEGLDEIEVETEDEADDIVVEETS